MIGYPRSKYYLLATNNEQEVWAEYSIKDHDGLAKTKPIMQAAMERRIQ